MLLMYCHAKLKNISQHTVISAHLFLPDYSPMNRDSFYPAIACFPLLLMLAGCAPMHETRQALSQQTPAAQVDTALPTALKNGWPDSQWWLEYHDNQLTSLINNALQNAPDMERQKMSAEGLMGPFALNDPAAGTTGPWYTNGTFGLTAGWHLDIWGKNRAEVTARLGTVKARAAEREQTRQLLAGSVARLYWEWQTQAALNTVLQQIEKEQNTIIATDRQLYQNGITSSVEGVETDINASKTRQQLNDVAGKMKIIEARLSALTNNQTKSLKLKPVALPKVASQLPDELGYSLLARRADLQAAHWYVESSLSTIDAAKAAFYPDINLMAFLQQDALHLSDLFRHSAQQMGVTAGLTLPIFDSGRLNANLDIAKAESNLSIASYNKAVVEAVNDVARAASQVQTLAEKNQHQAQIERDALRVVGLAQARFNAGIIAGSRVSEARIPALRERANGLLLQGQWLDASIQLTGALGGGYKR
ncbi:multidrug resistance outer membrane protein MdtQ [Escherichia coli]|nr:multidrug resistance outer membrane protein MdtQ [Escherichia coli]EFG1697267.1 multidrug resistance outer membrane protein MdtQ [Escherichia coli]EFG6182954.1 multidrug resistance outer membrane protein MdtQ [Escherichia coli]EFK4326445.1 multidrug resistance outer membrane protein MdtQ [Escherichia coli]EFM5935510.1 multidrug resistance outer membrane protein MdtQ [Escherichia coli]